VRLTRRKTDQIFYAAPSFPTDALKTPPAWAIVKRIVIGKMGHLLLNPPTLGHAFNDRQNLHQVFYVIDDVANRVPRSGGRFRAGKSSTNLHSAAHNLYSSEISLIVAGKKIPSAFGRRSCRADQESLAASKINPLLTRPDPSRAPWPQLNGSSFSWI
jgi:hypothetical protein